MTDGSGFTATPPFRLRRPVNFIGAVYVTAARTRMPGRMVQRRSFGLEFVSVPTKIRDMFTWAKATVEPGPVEGAP